MVLEPEGLCFIESLRSVSVVVEAIDIVRDGGFPELALTALPLLGGLVGEVVPNELAGENGSAFGRSCPDSLRLLGITRPLMV